MPSRLFMALLRLRIIRWFARRIVTPFTPFVLSDAWLSPEIHKYGLQTLNKTAVDLSKNREFLPDKTNPIFFVQSDQLEVFRDTVLRRISRPFILVSGKWHLPSLTTDQVVSDILASPFLTTWYSHNTPSPAKILPFPYGVNLSSAPLIWAAARLRPVIGFRRKGLFVPYARIHSHLEGAVRETRLRIQETAKSPRLGLTRYLLAVLRHQYVISPQGDRPDTYRHWESIALGAVPVSDLAPHWTELFGEHMVFVENLPKSLGDKLPEETFRPGTHLVSVKYWRETLRRDD